MRYNSNTTMTENEEDKRKNQKKKRGVTGGSQRGCGTRGSKESLESVLTCSVIPSSLKFVCAGLSPAQPSPPIHPLQYR